MKKNFSVLCSVIAAVALIVTVMGVKAPVAGVKNDVSYGALEQYYDDADDMNTTMQEPTESTTSSLSGSLGDFSDLLGGLGGSGDLGSGLLDGIGGISGIFGDAGDIFGSLLGGDSGSTSGGVLNTTQGGDDVIYIDPVPAATQAMTQGETLIEPASDTQAAQSTVPVADTLNPTATTNPYQKPTGEIKPGDMGDGVKWIQWNLIYTGYAPDLKEATGIYDDATVELVKKLQTENGLTPDGIVNDDDIAAIELLYYRHIINAQTTSAQASAVDTTATGAVGNPLGDDGSDVLIIIIAAVLVALIWIVAIIVIVIILIKKKKKAKKAEADKKVGESKPEADKKPVTNGDMSLSDLFEEANNRKK